MFEPTEKKTQAAKKGCLPASLRTLVDQYWSAYRDQAAEDGVRVPSAPDFRRALERVWVGSDFVAHTCVREPSLLQGLLDSGDLLGDYGERDIACKVERLAGKARDEDALATGLRQLRQREMVRIVWRDLAGWAPLEETLRDLSLLAEACLDASLIRLHGWMCKEFGVPRSADGRPQSLVVLGMGKLGAKELNVSSDIDLIFAYPEEGQTRKRGGLSNDEFFTRLGQRLIRVIGDTTALGFVFRVDMRLRPYGESGPLVMSFDAMEDYYQSQGREWERYAMIKARVVAGDREAGRQLLETLRPFVYRRYLDFGAFESLRTMKALIAREVARKGMERNVKLGAGGIREVEFIGQAFQLVRGGREPALRERGILKVLALLTELDYLPAFVSRSLIDAYRYLRAVENRLQAFADRQTHSLPGDELDRLRLAYSMGHADWPSFVKELDRHRRQVHSHFEQVFAAPQAEAGGERGEMERALTAVWLGLADDGAGVLQGAGYQDATEALRLLQRLREGHAYRALSTGGRERMDRLMPMLIAAVGASYGPEETLMRIVNMIEAIAGRTAYLSLLVENPMALSQLVKLCAASPWIAALLTQHPLLLDELLDPRTLYRPLDRQALQQELRAVLRGVDPDDLEQQMEVLRHFKQSHVLRVAAADVAQAMPLMVVSDHLTEIAEVVLAEVLDMVWAGLTARHGLPPGARSGEVSGFAIIGYGKLGGIELGYGSDLDLVFLHDSGDLEAVTAGPKSINSSVFYARLGQRIIHVLNTLTPSGVLYEVDMRLRPSGASGLLVSGIDAFADYQRNDAWTWEHQALVRARPVAGDQRIGARFGKIRQEVLSRQRDPQGLCKEVRDMRERMRGEFSRRAQGRFDLKQGRGGITDIEFIVQFAVLRWAHEHPDLLDYTDNIRQLEGLARNRLMPAADAALLSDAYRAYRARIHQLTLQEQPAMVEPEEFPEYREAVTRLWEEWMGN